MTSTIDMTPSNPDHRFNGLAVHHRNAVTDAQRLHGHVATLCRDPRALSEAPDLQGRVPTAVLAEREVGQR